MSRVRAPTARSAGVVRRTVRVRTDTELAVLEQDQPSRHRWLLAVTGVLHVIVGFPYLAAGLLAPLPGVAVVWALWLVGAYAIWRLRDRPGRAIWVPIGAAVAWVAVLTFGDLVLGWTA